MVKDGSEEERWFESTWLVATLSREMHTRITSHLEIVCFRRSTNTGASNRGIIYILCYMLVDKSTKYKDQNSYEKSHCQEAPCPSITDFNN